MGYGKAYADEMKDTIQKEVKTLWGKSKGKYPTFEDLEDPCHRNIQCDALNWKGNVCFLIWAKSARSDKSKEECPVSNSSVPPSPTALIPSLLLPLQPKVHQPNLFSVKQRQNTPHLPKITFFRSAGHSGSNAFHHLCDLKRIRTIPEFQPLLYGDGILQSILMLTVDEAPMVILDMKKL